jgi:hypothetical protein
VRGGKKERQQGCQEHVAESTWGVHSCFLTLELFTGPRLERQAGKRRPRVMLNVPHGGQIAGHREIDARGLMSPMGDNRSWSAPVPGGPFCYSPAGPDLVPFYSGPLFLSALFTIGRITTTTYNGGVIVRCYSHPANNKPREPGSAARLPGHGL